MPKELWPWMMLRVTSVRSAELTEMNRDLVIDVVAGRQKAN